MSWIYSNNNIISFKTSEVKISYPLFLNGLFSLIFYHLLPIFLYETKWTDKKLNRITELWPSCLKIKTQKIAGFFFFHSIRWPMNKIGKIIPSLMDIAFAPLTNEFNLIEYKFVWYCVLDKNTDWYNKLQFSRCFPLTYIWRLVSLISLCCNKIFEVQSKTYFQKQTSLALQGKLSFTVWCFNFIVFFILIYTMLHIQALMNHDAQNF